MPRAHYARIGHDITQEAAARSCLSKARYRTKNIARDTAILIAKTKGEAVPMRTYRCTLCGGWHLTSSQLLGGGTIQKKRRAMP